MRKSEKFAVIDTIRGMETSDIKATLKELDKWCENHKDVCNSHTWRTPGSRAARAREADYRTWQGEVTIGDVRILYFSTCLYVSFFRYHWKDSLEIFDDEDAKITFEDIELFRYAMQEILAKRS